MNDAIFSSGEYSSTDSIFGISDSSTTAERITKPVVPRKAAISKPIVNAVYAHIRAVRTLGRNTINTADIALALDLSESDVMRAVKSRRKKA